MQNRDAKPDILRIEELVRDVKTGDIKLPKFQRPFVWKRSDILKLWDSIYKGYPIGSILLWLTKQPLASERNIGDLEINERPDVYPTNYLLDGQQRLSSLCGALYWKGGNKKSYWNIMFDCDKEQFVYPKPDDEEKIHLFPLNKLIETRDYLNQCKKFDASPNGVRYQKNADKLLDSIKDYKIAAVRIGDMHIDEVAPIFERINSSGRQLTMVDLMRAATWKKGGFDLSDAIDAVRKALISKNFGDIKDMHILRSISGCAKLGVHKEDIDKLRDCTSDDLLLAAEKTIEGYKLAVDFITMELPLPSNGYLPYGLQLTFLVEFFNLCPSPNIHQRHELVKWFWKTSFTQRYGTSNTGIITRDLAQIRAFANGELDTLQVNNKINFKNFLNDEFALNKAASKILCLLLATRKPRSLLDGTAIDTYRALAVINKLEYHHIFPQAYLKKLDIPDKKINQLTNICMLNLSNNREISDSKPSVYFRKIEIQLGNKLIPVLESNFINTDAFSAALNDDFETFNLFRANSMTDDIKKLVADNDVL
jgi:hypothetical protein